MRVANVIAAGILARLLMLLLVTPSTGGDSLYYLAAATNGPDLYRPPLYPLFLSAFHYVDGLSFLAQSVLIIGVSILVLKWTGSLWSALLLATCPFIIVYEFRLLSEALLIALLVIGWLLLDRSKPLWAGLCVGLAILTNDVYLLLPLVALPIGWGFGERKKFTLMAAGAYLTVLPWASYNFVNHDRLVLSEGRMGFNLWVGTWERNGDWVDEGIKAENLPQYAFRSPEEKSRLLAALKSKDDPPFREAAFDHIRSEPLDTASTWLARYWRLWLGTRTDQSTLRLETGSPTWVAFKSAAWALNLFYLLASLWAILRTRRWIWALPALYIAAIYVPFHNSETRYSLPAISILLVPLGLELPSMLTTLRSILKPSNSAD